MTELNTRQFQIGSVINFRDLGGYPTSEGRRVSWRRIYRSGDFRNMTADDLACIQKEIGLTSVIDLRSADELERQGKYRFHEVGINYSHIPFPAGAPDSVEETGLFRESANLGQFYLYIISLPEFDKRITDALKIIADPASYPLVFHCAIGKDRTGILSAIVLSVLGVEDQVIIEDYALSESPVQKLYDNLRRNPSADDFIRKIPDSFWHAAPETMALFLSTLKKKHGSVVNYLLSLGVETSLIQGIRKTLLT